MVFRLPLDTEWEYCMRAGTDEEPLKKWLDDGTITRHANIRHNANATDNRLMEVDDGFLGSAPVGSLMPNALGLYDMSGNVWEYTLGEDEYNDVMAKSPVKIIARGTSWINDEKSVRRNHFGRVRLHAGPLPYVGFRVVLGPALESE
jgi:formylglycine-generating enzyme required for sulfatase activity